MKPNGLSMRVSESGIGLSVEVPSKVEDLVWEAVEEAINSGWTPERFKNEVADAWRERLVDDAKRASEILSN